MFRWFALLLLLNVLPIFAQEFRVIATSGFTLRHLVLENGEKLRVFVQIPFNRFMPANTENLTKRFQLFYQLREDLTTTTNNLPIKSAKIEWQDAQLKLDENEGFKFHFDIPKGESSPTGVLILDFVDLQQSQKHQVAFRVAFAKTKVREEYAIFKENDDFPLISGFVRKDEKFQIRNLSSGYSNFYVTKVKHTYSEAKLPMNISKPAQTKDLEVEKTFEVKSNEWQQWEEGLYIIKQAANAFYGLGLRVEPTDFPKIRTKEQLIEAVAYITLGNELKEIQSAEDPKKAIDAFWLTLQRGDVGKAKELVRKYYARIRKANYWFGSFKEGWKTDMGMIYAIFGEPDEVIWEKDSQKWIYIGNNNFQAGKSYTKVTFNFLRRPNQFFEDYYLLVRYVEYEEIWNKTIQALRQGIGL
ncbi:MAG: GWxTD domain-containing protein [Raineya sp.]|nr:GWxTD domain-containing protein [Raineya sp.]